MSPNPCICTLLTVIFSSCWTRKNIGLPYSFIDNFFIFFKQWSSSSLFLISQELFPELPLHSWTAKTSLMNFSYLLSWRVLTDSHLQCSHRFSPSVFSHILTFSIMGGGLIGGFKANISWFHHQKEEDHHTSKHQQKTREHKGPAPAVLKYCSCNQWAENVASGCMRIPNPHDQTSLTLAKPIAHYCHNWRPSSGLKQPCRHLDHDIESQNVNVPPVRHADETCKNPTPHHSYWKEPPEINSISKMPCEKHSNGIECQKGEIKFSQLVFPFASGERCPSRGSGWWWCGQAIMALNLRRIVVCLEEERSMTISAAAAAVAIASEVQIQLSLWDMRAVEITRFKTTNVWENVVTRSFSKRKIRVGECCYVGDDTCVDDDHSTNIFAGREERKMSSAICCNCIRLLRIPRALHNTGSFPRSVKQSISHKRNQ